MENIYTGTLLFYYVIIIIFIFYQTVNFWADFLEMCIVVIRGDMYVGGNKICFLFAVSSFA